MWRGCVRTARSAAGVDGVFERYAFQVRLASSACARSCGVPSTRIAASR